MQKNNVEPDRLKMTIWRIRIECWITKATNTHTHRICNTYNFPLQEWLHERAPTYIVGLVNFNILTRCYCIQICIINVNKYDTLSVCMSTFTRKQPWPEKIDALTSDQQAGGEEGGTSEIKVGMAIEGNSCHTSYRPITRTDAHTRYRMKDA